MENLSLRCQDQQSHKDTHCMPIDFKKNNADLPHKDILESETNQKLCFVVNHVMIVRLPNGYQSMLCTIMRRTGVQLPLNCVLYPTSFWLFLWSRLDSGSVVNHESQAISAHVNFVQISVPVHTCCNFCFPFPFPVTHFRFFCPLEKEIDGDPTQTWTCDLVILFLFGCVVGKDYVDYLL